MTVPLLIVIHVLAVVCGVYSLHRLLAVREEGEIDEAVAGEFYREVRRALRGISTAAGLQRLTSLPYGRLLPKRREDPPPDD